MYYKITNKECEVYKKLHELRTRELEIEEENVLAIKTKTGLDFETFLGDKGQQNFNRVTEYVGFKFTEPEKVDLKIWKIDKDNPDIFVPNTKYKLGREMGEFLRNGLNGSKISKVFDILGITRKPKFTFPYVEIVDDVILLFFDHNHEPNDPNIVEITKKEFEELNR